MLLLRAAFSGPTSASGKKVSDAVNLGAPEWPPTAGPAEAKDASFRAANVIAMTLYSRAPPGTRSSACFPAKLAPWPPASDHGGRRTNARFLVHKLSHLVGTVKASSFAQSGMRAPPAGANIPGAGPHLGSCLCTLSLPHVHQLVGSRCFPTRRPPSPLGPMSWHFQPRWSCLYPVAGHDGTVIRPFSH